MPALWRTRADASNGAGEDRTACDPITYSAPDAGFEEVTPAAAMNQGWRGVIAAAGSSRLR